MSNRLHQIASRQAKTRARDVLFVAFVALAAVVGISSVNTAAHAAASTQLVTTAANVESTQIVR